jgi:aspartate kinase
VRCDIYTTWTASTPPTPASAQARKLDRIAFEEMLELASLGAKVLQTRSVELAMRYKVKLRVLSSFEAEGNETGRHPCLPRGGHHGIERRRRRGLQPRRGQAHAHLRGRPPGIAAAIFGPLAEAGSTWT